ncbi:hypothetical protein GH733_013511 [Mirounga leonina]|nr:hypothetical protein GH733_013511 [Mirounga leonina]
MTLVLRGSNEREALTASNEDTEHAWWQKWHMAPGAQSLSTPPILPSSLSFPTSSDGPSLIDWTFPWSGTEWRSERDNLETEVPPVHDTWNFNSRKFMHIGIGQHRVLRDETGT